MDISHTGQTPLSPLSSWREGLELLPKFYGMEMKLSPYIHVHVNHTETNKQCLTVYIDS